MLMKIRTLKWDVSSDRDTFSKELERYFKQDMIVPILGSGFTVGERTNFNSLVPSGNQMKEYMISQVKEKAGLSEIDLSKENFSIVSSLYNDHVDENDRREYFKNSLSQVKLSKRKKLFVSIPFKTIYTLNIDDAIEASNENIEVILPNRSRLDENTLGDFRKNGKTILFKVHGDITDYLKYKEPFIFTKSQYVSSLTRNKNVLSQLGTDLLSNCAIFIGCSLDDEIDLMYAASEGNYTNDTLKQTYFVTHKELDVIEEYKLQNYKIDTVVQLPSKESYDEFYNFLKVSYDQSQKHYKDFLALNPKVVFDESNEYSFDNDFAYLVNSYHIYRDFLEKKKVYLPSFFISRELLKIESNFQKIKESSVVVLYGHRFSGKSYVLLDLYNRFSKENRILIPQTTNLDYEKLIGIFERTRDTIIFIDSNNIDDLVIEYISKFKKTILENNLKIIFTLTSAEKESLFVLHSLKTLSNEDNFVSRFYINNFFTDRETSELNRKMDSTLVGKFEYSNERNVTILDNIYKQIQRKHKSEDIFTTRVLNKRIKEDDLDNKIIDILVLFATNNSAITIKNIEKFELGKVVDNFGKDYQPIVQFSFIEDFEKGNYDTSSQKFICNSNVWLLMELQRIASQSSSHSRIVQAYQRIIKSVIAANKYDESRQRREIAKYIKFDEINDIFSDSHGARQLIDKIYEGLFGLLRDNIQYFHQRAKSLSWRDRDLTSLEQAVRFIEKAQNDFVISYETDDYKERSAYKHICYTKAIIYVKIAKHDNFQDLSKNNKTIDAIAEAFYDNENINYIESDNKRGNPNSIVKFIKEVSFNRKFEGEERATMLNELFSMIISDIPTTFNHKRFKQKMLKKGM